MNVNNSCCFPLCLSYVNCLLTTLSLSLCVCVSVCVRPSIRNQPGDGGKPCGHREHAAVPADAQVLEGQAPGAEETGKRKAADNLTHKGRKPRDQKVLCIISQIYTQNLRSFLLLVGEAANTSRYK